MTAAGDHERDILLFSYGTLQDHAVQQACFGRLLSGEPDMIAGYRRSTITLEGDEAPGSVSYPILDPSSDPEELVAGAVLSLDRAELARADLYEGPQYQRIRVATRAGRIVWVYIRA